MKPSWRPSWHQEGPSTQQESPESRAEAWGRRDKPGSIQELADSMLRPPQPHVRSQWQPTEWVKSFQKGSQTGVLWGDSPGTKHGSRGQENFGLPLPPVRSSLLPQCWGGNQPPESRGDLLSYFFHLLSVLGAGKRTREKETSFP